jgi:hypothetical protein
MTPPLLKGGQGRDEGDILRDGVPSVWTLLVVVGMVLLVVGRCVR